MAVKKEFNVHVGKRLKEERNKLGKTQEEFAEILDISIEHYSNLENGVYGLLPEKMLILHKELNIDPTYLITGEHADVNDIDYFIANCSTEDKNTFISEVLDYMMGLITDQNKDK